MEPKAFRKLTSRILRHSGFIVRMNKKSQEYEFFYNSSPTPIIYCRPITDLNEKAENEYFLCFRVLSELQENPKILYERMIKRFTRLAPSINISLENESEPVFTDEQVEKLDQLLDEYDNKGENTDEKENLE